MQLFNPGLEGTWQMIRAEFGGEMAPELVAQQTELEFSAGAYVVRFNGGVVDHGAFEIGAIVATKTLLLRGVAGRNAGRTIPCLFQVRGERLRICFGFDGVAPADFTTRPGQQRYLATYRRKTT